MVVSRNSRKRARTQYDDDDEEPTESAFKAINVLLANAHSGRPTKTKTLTDLMGGGKWSNNSRIINSILKEKCALKVSEIPTTNGGPVRGELCLLSTLTPQLQKVVNRYAYARKKHEMGLQKMVIYFVITSNDSITEDRLARRLVDARIFDTEGQAINCIQRMQAMRLLESKKQITQNTANTTRHYSVGPLAVKYYDKDTMVAELKDIFGYSSENQPQDLIKRNDEYLQNLVENCF